MNSLDQDRYSRQIRFAGIGEAGQKRLIEAAVVIVGCGALGTFQAGALARAGVGRLRLVDRDYVEFSNLQRQWLFDEGDARTGTPKAAAAAAHLAKINSEVAVEARVADLTSRNANDLLEDVDLILDGTDNFETRYLVNDFSVKYGVPWIYGAAVGSYGLAMPVIPEQTACLRCVYPEPPRGAQPTCETAGVVNTLTSLIASWQTSLALRILVGQQPEPTITTVDVWTGQMRQIAAPQRDPACACCVQKQFPELEVGSREPISLCGRNAVQIHDTDRPLDLDTLRDRLAPLGKVRANELAVRFTSEGYEMTFFPDGRAIIKGTNDPGVARSLYSRYVGA